MKRYWIKRQTDDGERETVTGPFDHPNAAIMARDALAQETGRRDTYSIYPSVESA